MTTQLSVGVVNPDAHAVVDAFTAGLQAGHDQHDAEILNRQFARDVIRASSDHGRRFTVLLSPSSSSRMPRS